jgi:hypothetical protein
MRPIRKAAIREITKIQRWDKLYFGAPEDMYDASYYREQDERALRLARGTNDSETQEALERVARDYEDIAE